MNHSKESLVEALGGEVLEVDPGAVIIDANQSILLSTGCWGKEEVWKEVEWSVIRLTEAAWRSFDIQST